MKSVQSFLLQLLSVTFLTSLLASLDATTAVRAEVSLTEPAISQTIPSATTETVDALVEQIMAERHIPGLSLAVVRDGKLIKTQSYGYLNRDLNVHTRPSSVFPIASVSKPFTATAIMLLVQSGQIELDAPISTYLTDTPAHWENITVRHLLTHTAGLSESVYANRLRTIQTLSGFQTQASKVPLDFQPGEAWAYSNTGYNLAARIIETVSGQSFEAFMESHIFEPVGMGSTDVVRESYDFSNRATGYFWDGGQLQPHPFNRRFNARLMSILYGSGSVTSTVTDLARWEIALQKGELLTPELQTEMQKPVAMNSGRQFKYGLGWFVDSVNGHRMVSHGGNIWGFTTSIARFPDDRLTVILLANKDSESGDGLAMRIAQQYVPALAVNPDAPAVNDPNLALTAALLQYANGDATAITPTSEWQIFLSTPRGQSLTARFRDDLGRNQIKALELVDRENHPNGTRYRYRAITADDRKFLSAIVTPHGLLAALGTALE